MGNCGWTGGAVVGRSACLQLRDEFRQKCLLGKLGTHACGRAAATYIGLPAQTLNLLDHLVHIAVGSRGAGILIPKSLKNL
jgi:hypothetical protein